MNGLAVKELARALAVVMHEGQSRKGTGEPYIEHVQRIADSVNGWKAKTAAYLHDLVEDTEMTLEVLSWMFPEDIVEAVDVLTRRDGETYKDFIARACESTGFALEVKIADVRDNLRDINDVPGGGPGLERRYTTALSSLLEAQANEVPPRPPGFLIDYKCECLDGGHEKSPGRCLCGGKIPCRCVYPDKCFCR